MCIIETKSSSQHFKKFPLITTISHLPGQESLQSYGKNSHGNKESPEEVHQVDAAPEGRDLEDVRQNNLEAPDNHDRGWGGEGDGGVEAVDPRHAEDRLGQGQAPDLKAPTGEG